MYHLVPSLGTYVLRTQDGCSKRNDLEQKKHEVHKLIHHSDSCNTVVGVATQHKSIYRAQHHHQQGLDEYRSCKCNELFAQFSISHTTTLRSFSKNGRKCSKKINSEVPQEQNKVPDVEYSQCSREADNLFFPVLDIRSSMRCRL